jgi:hypothetical protein
VGTLVITDAMNKSFTLANPTDVALPAAGRNVEHAAQHLHADAAAFK